MTYYGDREKCYKCYRPKLSCMCKHVEQVDTKTKFIILMHPKEFKKVKNGTGFFTHLSLTNSELYIDEDFTNHKRVNEIIKEYQSFVLYPSQDALNLSKQNPYTQSYKKMAIFIIDATWSCSKTLLRKSTNLQALKHVSFETTRESQFEIKKQPELYCLSTIESTLCVLESLDALGVEELRKKELASFLNPFYEMIKYQKKLILQRANPRALQRLIHT